MHETEEIFQTMKNVFCSYHPRTSRPALHGDQAI